MTEASRVARLCLRNPSWAAPQTEAPHLKISRGVASRRAMSFVVGREGCWASLCFQSIDCLSPASEPGGKRARCRNASQVLQGGFIKKGPGGGRAGGGTWKQEDSSRFAVRVDATEPAFDLGFPCHVRPLLKAVPAAAS